MYLNFFKKSMPPNKVQCLAEANGRKQVIEWNDRGLRRITKLLLTAVPPVAFVSCNDVKRVFKLQRTAHESEVLLKLYDIMPSHTVKIQGTLGDVMILQYIPAFIHHGKRLATLDDLLEDMSDDILAHVIFQVACILHDLRHSIQFSHNDFKADNILLTPNTDPLMFSLAETYTPPVRVVIIDVETSTMASKQPPLHDMDAIVLEEFGLGPDMPDCEWSDFHLCMLEIWVRVKRHMPVWKSDFLTFLLSIVPYELIKTFQEGGVHVSRMNRLTRTGRVACNEACAPLSHVIQSEFLQSRIHGCPAPPKMV